MHKGIIGRVVVVSLKIAIHWDLGTEQFVSLLNQIWRKTGFSTFQIKGYDPQVLEIVSFLAIVATPMNNAYSMHNAYRYVLLLMRTTKWPSKRTGKDRWHVLNNARDTIWLLSIDWNEKPCGTEPDCKMAIIMQQNVGSSSSYLPSLDLVQRENQCFF